MNEYRLGAGSFPEAQQSHSRKAASDANWIATVLYNENRSKLVISKLDYSVGPKIGSVNFKTKRHGITNCGD